MGNRKIVYDEAQVRRLWAEEVRQHDICIQCDIRPGSFWHVRRSLDLPERPCDRTLDFSHRLPPTEAEIAERAAAIRAGWSPEEQARREAGIRPRAEVRSYQYNGVFCRFSGVAD